MNVTVNISADNQAQSQGFDLSVAAVLAASLAAIVALFWPGLVDMVGAWDREEYSHGYLIPFVAIYLFVRRLPRVAGVAPDRRWVGLVIAVFAAALGVVGNISNIADLSQYGFLAALVAVSVSFLGLRATILLWVPIVYLVFMIPLPQVIYLKLSAGLQLWSSQLGTFFIQLMNVPVYLDGNIIDLGVYKLQVVEACSGLRYLFPLMSFGFLFAALYRGPVWHKIVLFFATIPITIVLNSFRIGVIGVLVDRFGISQAEGFLHYFEGWVIFIACIAILFGLLLVLMRLSRHRLSLGEALDLDFRLQDLSLPSAARGRNAKLAGSAAILGILVVAIAGLQFVPTTHTPINLPRSLALFPDRVGGWTGNRSVLPAEIVEVLGADDYLVTNYKNPNVTEPVSLFIAFYRSQTRGEAVHSPEICVPGSGWEITQFAQHKVADVSGRVLIVNRAIIQKGVQRQMVYYWFEQRGRQLTSEYLVKGYILWDGLTRGRTDGSIVRVVTPIDRRGGEAKADQRLTEYLRQLYPTLPRFLPS